MKLLWLNVGITPNKKGVYLTFESIKEIISREDGTPYLIRWHLLHTPIGRVMLHKIILSDHDCPHDHPWNFVSIMLSGSYIEYRYKELANIQVSKHITAPAVMYRPANWSHRLEVSKPCWTLVFTSSWRRHWGFWTKAGWLPWKQYKSTQNCD